MFLKSVLNGFKAAIIPPVSHSRVLQISFLGKSFFSTKRDDLEPNPTLFNCVLEDD